MKKFYKVSFEYCEGIYCTNIANAENVADVEREYSKYAWKSIKEAMIWEVEEARMKGMPFIEVDHIAEPEPAETVKSEPETAKGEEETMKSTAKKSAGYYNEKTLAKFAEALKTARKAVQEGEDVRVRFSAGNTKMGAVASVSTLPFLTCPASCAGTCGAKCYAAKLANLRPNVLKNYAINTALALLLPEEYWRQIAEYVRGVRYFRFHVSGDIINADYFAHMIECARNNPHAEILCFTKRYDVVNSWIDANGDLPENLHILFSGWQNLTPDNPHSLPETNVFTCEDDFNDDWKVCGGNCFNCACRGVGCWQVGNGETIAFKMH